MIISIFINLIFIFIYCFFRKINPVKDILLLTILLCSIYKILGKEEKKKEKKEEKISEVDKLIMKIKFLLK